MDHEKERRAQLRDALKRQEEFRKESEDNYNNKSKQRLNKIVETKIRTSFIGALSAFENEFSDFLADPSIKERWNRVRNKILDNGNGQIRAVRKELEQYNIHWKRNELKFVKDGNKLRRQS